MGATIVALLLSSLFALPASAQTATTGAISGTITDTSNKPLADVRITASSPSQTATATTNARGFYSIVNLSPDTYTVSFQKQGYTASSVPGITVFQLQTATLNEQLQTQLRTIAVVRATGGSNLVKSNQGSDVYNVTGAQLTAATNPVDTHETLYQYLAVTPGVTSTGPNAQPRVRGGQVTDLGYQFEGIPIQDRITGFFTTNLANIGISNIEVYTGGLPASGSTNGTGYFNSVLKTGSYPGYTQLSYQVTSPAGNQFLTFERAGGTPNHKFTYYIGFDGVNSQNQYDYGENTYYNVLFGGFNGPGPVKTRDWVSNIIYRPSPKDAIQGVYTNSNGDFDFNYLLTKSNGEPPALAFQPCPGNVPNSASASGFGGGVAPNGQTCPIGFFWGALPNGGGNIWHHYGALGKIQWNHTIDDHSFFNLSVAENFNQYIFDQPLIDPNIPSLENVGGPYNTSPTCPAYPYATGTPVQQWGTGTNLNYCAYANGVEAFWGDRRSNMYFGNLEYVNQFSSNFTLHATVNHEIDQNVFNYFLTDFFNTDGSWPDNYLHSIYPTTIDTASAQGDVRFGHLLLSPGVAYAQEHYAYPNGGKTQRIVNPTFNGTYTFDPDNVVRFSYGNTSSFVGTGYVYRTSSGTYNPDKAGFAFEPQLNHSADLMFEHNFGNGTTMRIGPWWNSTTNYYESYRPIVSLNPYKLGPSVLSNNGAHNAFGAEFALNHVDTRPVGISYWLGATYDNYWTTSTSLAGSFVNSPIPPNLIAEGVRVRAFANPLLQGTLVGDFHSDRFHFDPMLVYSTEYFYNIGATSDANGNPCVDAGGAPQICQNELIAGANWWTKLVAYEELGPSRNVILGLRVDNFLNNNNDVAPCLSDGTGCFPFNGPQSGVITQPNTYIFQNYSQGPRTFFFFAGVKI